MTDTTKPNNDDKRSADHEAADNPHGPAMGPPEGTASSGSTSLPLDMALERELAKEFGFYPATTNPVDIERHRRLNAAADAASAHGYRYDPCDRCGQATRYKQFPLVCRCTTPDRCSPPAHLCPRQQHLPTLRWRSTGASGEYAQAVGTH